MSQDFAYWIGLSKVPGIGPARLRLLLEHFDGELAQAWEADGWQLARSGLDRRTVESLLTHRPQIDLAHERDLVEQHGVIVLTWQDERYPRLLRTVNNAPALLYLRGALHPADEWAIAIVGTRRISAYGKRVTELLASGLAEAGLTIVSGLALGVDRVAHESALQAGGRTIAVLANGVERPYPASNRKLAERVVAEGRGLLMSDYPIGTHPEASNFPPRNRIISGLSLGTIVVEAGERSGALITARFALEQGREVFAVPGNIFHPGSQGTNALLAEGAALASSVTSVLQALNVQMAEPQTMVRQTVPPTDGEAQVLGHLNATPLHIDELGHRCQLSPADLSSTLALLELKGLVRHVGNMCYVRTD